MDYREIVAVTGIGGLFQLMATKSDGAIVKSLGDKTTKFIPARLHNVTPLESIEVYTTGENVRLHEVFQKMKENDSTSRPDPKSASSNDIKGYFKGIFPEFDEERVYVSDMKKMLKWYDILKENDLLNFEAARQEAEANTEEPNAAANESEKDSETTTEEVSEKPAKKARAKKSADEAAAAEGEEKPKKTARKKKTAEEGEGDASAEKPAKKTAKKKKEEE